MENEADRFEAGKGDGIHFESSGKSARGAVDQRTASVKGPARNTEREAKWRNILRAHAQSELSVREFCRDHNLREPQFYAWRREISRRDATSITADLIARKTPETTRFLAVQVETRPQTSTKSSLQVRLHDVCIEIASDFDEATLSRLLKALRAASC